MAMASKDVQINVLDQMFESQADILSSFQQCHDLCVQSRLFSDDIILQIDKCAVDFRQLSLDTVTVIERVSNQWLDEVITLFKSIDTIDDPPKSLVLLGEQARDFARCFKIIAAWARDICAKFHQAQDDTIKEAKEFKASFKAAVDRAKRFEEEVDEQHTRAEKCRKDAKSTEDKWRTARLALFWSPLALVTTSIGTSAAESRVAEASKRESRAAEELWKAKEDLHKKESQNEKAKVRAD